jgi:hypothetical protein
MQPNDRYQIPAPQVIGEVIDGEAIVVNLETGAYYSLQGAGSLVWTLVSAGASRADIVAGIAGAYSGSAAEIAQGVDRLLEDLLNQGLIERTGEDNATQLVPGAVPNGDAAPFVAPVLTKYTDMADLLLLDPIHDVSPAGWPQPAKPN